jgi:MinD superfamily P-loop ATPase
MKQLVILSGKGGTGKTSISASFAHLAYTNRPQIRTVLADADVDAANLEFVLASETLESFEFLGGQAAVINHVLCNQCGTCETVCRFDAIVELKGVYQIDPIACEGCAACMFQCPSEAIQMLPQVAGQWFHSQTRCGPLFHAALRPAQENSGKLVMLVKQQASLLAMDENYSLVLVDGPPGVGCPVISAVSGANLALIVAEPTAAGVHDMRRVLATTTHFGLRAVVCINKADIYPKGVAEIEEFCLDQCIQILGNIPFDITVTEAMVQGQPVTLYDPDAPASMTIRKTWRKVVIALEDSPLIT